MTYQCQKCGYISRKWLGKCPDCNEWNTFSEAESKAKNKLHHSGKSAESLASIEITQDSKTSTKLKELDRVLGNGVVAGQVILIGGNPGIGKSTLLTQVLNNMSTEEKKGVYLSAEESPLQVKMRTERLAIENANIFVLPENNISLAIEEIKRLKPAYLVVDSIQTVFSDTSASIPGSISQIKECAAILIDYIKYSGTVLFLIGHVTKEGAIAGPKVLEHMVDTVLYFESETSTDYRIVRSLKNRFGKVNEIAIFEMTSSGLKEVLNPTNIFIANRGERNIGSIIFPLVEGSRIFLVEVQALVSNSSYAMPRRNAQGIEQNRMNLLIAVAEKILGLNLYGNDIFINIPGGIKVSDPSVDLAVITAILSSFLNREIDSALACFGEVGLNGEVRKASFWEERIKEASRMGFRKIVTHQIDNGVKAFEKINILPINNISGIPDCIN